MVVLTDNVLVLKLQKINKTENLPTFITSIVLNQIESCANWVKQRYGEIRFDLAANLRSDWF